MTDILKRIDRLRSRLNNIACELETLQQIVAAGGLKSKKTVTKNKQKTVMTDFEEQLQLPLEGNVPNTLTNNDNNDMDEQKSVMTVFKKEKSLIKKERIDKEEEEELNNAQSANNSFVFNREQRCAAFKEQVMSFSDNYNNEMLKLFYTYYTQWSTYHAGLMRFEVGNFCLEERLANWIDYTARQEYFRAKTLKLKQKQEATAQAAAARRQRETERRQEEQRRAREVIPRPIMLMFNDSGLGNIYELNADKAQRLVFDAVAAGQTLPQPLCQWATQRAATYPDTPQPLPHPKSPTPDPSPVREGVCPSLLPSLTGEGSGVGLLHAEVSSRTSTS